MSQEKVYYPLTNAQRIMYVSQKFSLKKSVVDICTMIHFDCEMDLKLLMQATYLGLMRNQSSGVRLHKVDKEVMQYLYPDGPEPISVLDYSARTQAELDADLNKWSQTPFPKGSMDCQLYRVKMIKEPSGFYGIYFCVSHLAFDAYALMTMASDIMEIYAALRDGTPIVPNKGDYIQMIEKDFAYQGSDKEKKDIEFCIEEAYGGGKDEPYGAPTEPSLFKRKPGKNYYTTVDLFHSKAHHVNLTIPAKLDQRVNEMAAQLRIPPTCFYMLGLRSYLSNKNGGVQDISMALPSARRATLLQKRSGGTRVLALPIRMKMDGNISVTDALREISARETRLFLHMNCLLTDVSDPAKKPYGAGTMDGYFNLSMTYNPYRVAFPEGIRAHLSTYSTGANSLPVYLSIMALDDSGDLTANYDCIDRYNTPETPINIHNYMLKTIAYVLDHPDAKLETLSKL